MLLPEKLFIALQYVLPQHTVSRLVGRIANSRTPWVKNTFMQYFINHFNVDMSEAEQENFREYATFNDFFTRALKPGAREICSEKNSIASPADGAVSELGPIELGSIMQAKGQSYSLAELLAGDAGLTNRYLGGQFATIYLSPKDYHRVHMPLTGTLLSSTYVPGKLFSVNQATANNVPALFSRNERLICEFQGEDGPFLVILVGAMIVAGIETVWQGQVAPTPSGVISQDYQNLEPITLEKGEEMGRFKLGSTVILVTPENTSQWREDLANGSVLKMGEKMGEVVTPKI